MASSRESETEPCQATHSGATERSSPGSGPSDLQNSRSEQVAHGDLPQSDPGLPAAMDRAYRTELPSNPGSPCDVDTPRRMEAPPDVASPPDRPRSEPVDAAGPLRAYLDRRAQRGSELARWARLDLAISRARTGVAIATALVAWCAFGAHLFSAWWISAPILPFVALLSAHERVLTARRRADRAVGFYDAGIRRLEGRWIGRGVTRTDFATAAHPYAADLDVFGRGSAMDLICVARTGSGQQRLAEWLMSAATSDAIRERQAAIEDLRNRVEFREELALLGDDTVVEAAKLDAWGAAPSGLDAAWVQPLAVILAVAGITATAAWLWLRTGGMPLLGVLAAGQLFQFAIRLRVRRAFEGVEESAAALAAVEGLLARLEREQVESPPLRRIKAELVSDGVMPSDAIRRLRRLLEWLRLRESIYFAPIALISLWAVQFACGIDRWRKTHGTRLQAWLDVAADFEALASLAGYAFEHPADPFPSIEERGPCFIADEIAHPLLTESVAVRNSMDLSDGVRLAIVSGSNMSGKSTLLRSIGVNAALALAGAPVRAQSLTLSPLQIGASLRTIDSLQGGVSRFYAEVLRLRQIVGLAESGPPVLFLLDEILHGTNSHDRLIGAEAVVRSLVRRGAIGLITTHDLALAQIQADPDLCAINVHFEDQLQDGKMAFDYLLRPGVVEKSNALELMRAAGLDV